MIGRKANANKARADQRWDVRRKHEAELVYVANSEPARWVPGGGRAGVSERAPISDCSNRRELLVTGGLTLRYSLRQANVGTAYRYRAQVLPFFLTFAAVGVRTRRQREQQRQLVTTHKSTKGGDKV